jgi:DNA-binding NarL/FixJ family response regulator
VAGDVKELHRLLPLVNGTEVTRQIRTRALLPHTEVLLLTTQNYQVRVGNLLRAGAEGYL